ncbi:MAG: hypothetical protein MI975_05475 [Cytophagales bacterium]|nr:hypothetical protein [Cytophagales bacterium]
MEENLIDDQLVERIVRSKSFGTSMTYVNLLKYLIACTQSGSIPKEATIGAQVFGAATVEDYDSAKVRVYIFNLRKKLKRYYDNEGKVEEFEISIPKGGYRVQISKRISAKGPDNSIKYRIIAFGSLAVLVPSIVLNFVFWTGKRKVVESYEVLPESKFWSTFIKDNRLPLLVLGDLFIFSEEDRTNGMTRTIRIPEINTVDEFELYKKNYPDSTKEIGDLSYTYLIKNSSNWIESLTKIFFSKHKHFQTRVISRIDAKDLHDHNIIFVGMQKTAGLFNNYFKNSKFNLIHDDTLEYRADQSDDRELYYPSGDPDNFHTDYGFVAKYPGPNNNTIFMFGGLWDTATSQSLKNFTDPNSIARLEDQMKSEFGKIPDHFEVLFRVSGIDRTELDTKVLYINELEKSNDIWTIE